MLTTDASDAREVRDQPRVTLNVNLPTRCGNGSMAGHALPTGHDTVITSQTWPLNVPAHHRLDPLGASITRTVEPALVGCGRDRDGGLASGVRPVAGGDPVEVVKLASGRHRRPEADREMGPAATRREA